MNGDTMFKNFNQKDFNLNMKKTPFERVGFFVFIGLYQGVSELVEAAGLGNQSRHKGSVVRGFEPHLPDQNNSSLTYCNIIENVV